MENEFKGKTVLITGGTKGLGLVTAQHFAEAGASHLILSFRSDQESADKARTVIEKLGAKCHLVECDLSEEGAADRLFDQIAGITDHLDIYVHNAAATAFKDLMDIKSHHIDKTFNITVKSFILGTQRAVPLMKNGGSIVSISGMDTLKAVPRHGLLGAAKSSLETLTAYFAHELAPKRIHINSVNPGFLETESTQKYLGPQFGAVSNAFAQWVPLKRPCRLKEIADVILFLSSTRSSWVVGQTLNVDGGLDFAMPIGRQ